MLYNSKSFVINITLSILLTLVCYGLTRAAIWSFDQTHKFAQMAIDPAMAMPVALVIQFGQNAVLYVRNMMKRQHASGNWLLGLALVFWVLVLLDAITNYGEWFVQHSNYQATDIPSTLAYAFGIFLCAGVVFVEEALAFLGAVTLHSWNQTLKSLGGDGIPMLDMLSNGMGMASPWQGNSQKPQEQKPQQQKHDGKQQRGQQPHPLPDDYHRYSEKKPGKPRPIGDPGQVTLPNGKVISLFPPNDENG